MCWKWGVGWCISRVRVCKCIYTHIQIHINTYIPTSTTSLYTHTYAGGGHGEIGYHLAKQLTAKGVKVTILNDQYNEQKQPFKVSWSRLRLGDWVIG